jgi:hypothetical protein
VATEEVASTGMEIGLLLVTLKQEILAVRKYRESNVPLNVLQLLDVHIMLGTF